MTSTDLVPITPADVKLALVDGTQLPEIDDPAEIRKSILSSILAADSAEAVFATMESTPIQELLGVPLMVDDVTWRPSAFKGDGPPIFSVVHATRGDDGERVTATCGGGSAMAALYRLQELEALPIKVRFELGKANEEGNRPLLIKRA